MLCIIAAYAVAVSVRPSIMFVYSIETNKHIFKIISLLGSHTILVFSYQTLWQYSDGDPLRGDRMQVGWAKIAILDEYLAILLYHFST